MNACLPLLLVVVASLSISVDSYGHLNENMNKATVKKTKDGWQCAGVTCPKKFTSYCTVTKILKPTEKLHTELLILCMDNKNKPRCGVTRTIKGETEKLLEVDEDGNTRYSEKESITVIEGTTIPRCPFVPPKL
ncbi:uncharacterized protein LOC119554371 [Drosophila subpulchrella]|uniref:uncharacterized protein LOC119554371 n=1 Tax=Drosophila subpulchrella TaxID=1486046 RepID=UPI0018A1753C|nr:uncharacterized protein LOC119554371 [Drosophila subpulchrella]